MTSSLRPDADLASLDVRVPSTGGNSYITDICRHFMLEREDPWLPTVVWVAALQALGIPSGTARSSLRRMSEAGFLVREPRSGSAGYSMSQPWHELMLAARAPADREDPRWLMVLFNVPESQREERHRLRAMLTRLGFGSLGNGVWLGSGASSKTVTSLLDRTGLLQFVDLFHADYLGPEALATLVSRCWDLNSLSHDYVAVLETVAGLDPDLEDEEAFVAVVDVSNRLRKVAERDPELPASALPLDWPGERARSAAESAITRHRPRARAWLDSLHG